MVNPLTGAYINSPLDYTQTVLELLQSEKQLGTAQLAYYLVHIYIYIYMYVYTCTKQYFRVCVGIVREGEL